MCRKKWGVIIFCVILLFNQNNLIFSQDDESETRGTVTGALIGAGEVLLYNALVMSFNIAAYNLTGIFEWSTPNPQSIRRNLTQPWEWTPDDGFIVNQIGHPYQGGLYYNAGRVNGFGFYESILFSAFGSATWEVFFENNKSSINDLINTVSGSVSMGEMFYRLYIEAYRAGVPAPIAFLISPMAGLHRLLTKWEPPAGERNLYRFQTSLGAGYSNVQSSLLPGNEEHFSFQGFFPHADISVTYGNPFNQESKTPFKHFEFDFTIGLVPGKFMDIRFISDGYLFSFNPVYSEKNMMSTGLTLNLDAATIGKYGWTESPTISQHSNALNWTVKYQHLFSEDFSFQTRFHLGFTFIGASIFYSPSLLVDLNNFGAGLNSKLFLTLEHKKIGRLDMSVFGYTLRTYPGTSKLSGGTVYWMFSNVSLSFNITKRISAGITGSLALERGFFNGFPDTWKHNRMIKAYVSWNT